MKEQGKEKWSSRTELPEFRDYIRYKYPELDEDLITMIEDLILREKQRKGGYAYEITGAVEKSKKE
ncbi:hypothetical protein ES703_21239 [subsurface metagenome]